MVGLVSDFFLQMFFFTTVLSIDIRRMEVGDGHGRQVFTLNLSAAVPGSETRTAYSCAFHCVTEREQGGLDGQECMPGIRMWG